MSKETYTIDKSDPCKWQKRPMHIRKETYVYKKRAYVVCAVITLVAMLHTRWVYTQGDVYNWPK